MENTIIFCGVRLNSKQIIERLELGCCVALSEGVNVESRGSLVDTLLHYGHDKESLLKYDKYPYWVTANDGFVKGINNHQDVELILEEINGENDDDGESDLRSREFASMEGRS